MNDLVRWESRLRFDEERWEQVKNMLPTSKRGRPSDTRNFFEAVFFHFRTGSSWRDLPPDFGRWGTIFNRFNRWCKRGYFFTIFEAVPTGFFLLVAKSTTLTPLKL